MKDERRRCANCQHQHAWGILRYSLDNVPLYGAWECWCHCDRFVDARAGEDANLPAMTQQQTESLWQETSFLNAQVPAATRMVVKKLMDLGDGKDQPGLIGRLFGKGDGKTAIERQWPEFVGFVISQITDMRGALVREESKFAHLVAHTDEVVESMRAVSQLAERLNGIYEAQGRIVEAIEKLAEKVSAMESSGQAQSAVPLDEIVQTFADKSKPLWNEPIVTDADPVDD